MRGSRGRTGRVRTTRLENHKAIGFLSNTGPDSLETHKATKPAFNVGLSSAHQLYPLWQLFLDPRVQVPIGKDKHNNLDVKLRIFSYPSVFLHLYIYCFTFVYFLNVMSLLSFFDFSSRCHWLSVTSESMCTKYWLTACSSLLWKKCG